MSKNVKIAGLVPCCRQCGHYRNRGCDKVGGQPVVDPDAIAPFCPLSDYPAKEIASQEATIRLLQQRRPDHFGQVLLCHIARKLKCQIFAEGSGLDVVFKDGVEESRVALFLDRIQVIEPLSYNIVFIGGDGKTYKLVHEGDHPELYEQSGEESWLHHYVIVK